MNEQKMNEQKMNEQESQYNFTKLICANMAMVLNSCQSNKKDCVCSVRVRYLDDKEANGLPEHKQYKIELFCDESGSEFHKKITQELDKKNKHIKPKNVLTKAAQNWLHSSNT